MLRTIMQMCAKTTLVVQSNNQSIIVIVISEWAITGFDRDAEEQAERRWFYANVAKPN